LNRNHEYRGFIAHCEEKYNLWEVHSLNDLTVPVKLRHKFTNRKFLEKAIDKYLEENKNEE
jgi:hypothetical protein